MSPSKKVVLGVLAGLAFAVVGDRFIDGATGTAIFLLSGVIVLIAGVIWGKKAPLVFRSFASILILYWAYAACLVGRTTGVGLTRATLGAALMMWLPRFSGQEGRSW